MTTLEGRPLALGRTENLAVREGGAWGAELRNEVLLGAASVRGGASFLKNSPRAESDLKELLREGSLLKESLLVLIIFFGLAPSSDPSLLRLITGFATFGLLKMTVLGFGAGTSLACCGLGADTGGGGGGGEAAFGTAGLLTG